MLGDLHWLLLSFPLPEHQGLSSKRVLIFHISYLKRFLWPWPELIYILSAMLASHYRHFYCSITKRKQGLIWKKFINCLKSFPKLSICPILYAIAWIYNLNLSLAVSEISAWLLFPLSIFLTLVLVSSIWKSSFLLLIHHTVLLRQFKTGALQWVCKLPIWQWLLLTVVPLALSYVTCCFLCAYVCWSFLWCAYIDYKFQRGTIFYIIPVKAVPYTIYLSIRLSSIHPSIHAYIHVHIGCLINAC